MISRETIDKIYSAAKIEEVVGDYVTLRKRGANLIGLCPFHNEKTARPKAYTNVLVVERAGMRSVSLWK